MLAGWAFLSPMQPTVLFVAEWLLVLLLKGVHGSLEGWALARPVKELKGFAQVPLAPGERQTAQLELPAQQPGVYDEGQGAWTVEPTGYGVSVGPSSRTGALLHAPFRMRS